MRVCVVGCGAIGGLYAAHLASVDGVEVWAYDVSQEHVDAINRNGLRLTGHADLTAPVQARTNAGEIPPCEFGIVAVKAAFTDSAMAATAPVFADGAVCSVQNGIGNEEVVAGHVPRVMRGVCLPAGHVEAPGVIHMDAPGDTWIGPFEPQAASLDEVGRLADAITRGGMNTLALEDARGAQWTKLLFNSSTNPLAALTGLTHGQICTLPPVRELIGRLVAEGRAVADALGITLDADPEAVIDQAARDNFDHRPSMLQDVIARRPTEIQALNGGIVRAGREAGVPTPLHEAITALITGLEQSWKETTMKIGEIEIAPLSDGELHIPPTELLNKDMDAWQKHSQFLDDDGLLPVNFGGFLVRTPDHVLVVDTGIGGGAIPEMPIGSFPDRLAEAGVSPAEVDVVVLTHLHFDHVGWSTDGERVLFENAEHHASKVDWDYWCGPDPTAETGPGREEFGAIPAPERLAPLAERMNFFDGDTEIVPGVRVRPAPGHTPGHYIVEISSNGETALLLADVAHSPAELLEDDWSSPTDEDPELAQRTRAELAQELIRTGALATMTHFGGNGFGRLTESDGARSWKPVG